MSRLRTKRAQSIIEFVMLFMVVAGAIMFTYKYVQRSMQARLKQVQEHMEYKE